MTVLVKVREGGLALKKEKDKNLNFIIVKKW